MDTRDQHPTGPPEEDPRPEAGQIGPQPEDPAGPQAPPPGDPPPATGASSAGDSAGGPGQPPPTGQPPPGEPPRTDPQPPPTGPQPRRLFRSRDDRIIGGVCGGLGHYFGVDPVIFRIAAVALVLAAGSGIVLYLAAVLLIPEGSAATQPGAPTAERRSGLTVLAIVVAVLLLAPLLLPPVLIAGGVLLPIAVLLAIGLLVWWLVSGKGPEGGTGEILRRSLLGVAVLVALGLIAQAGVWAAGTGGPMVAAGLVIGAGAALVVAAFLGSTRWLILPALALTVPAAFVAVIGIDLNGGLGERHYRPASAAELRDRYKLGMGELVIDLRGSQLPPGDTPLSVDVGIGEARVLVPEDVCVASRSDIGVGAVQLFDGMDGGVDLDREDLRRAAAGVPRLVIDAHVGVGAFHVGHRHMHGRHFGRGRMHHADGLESRGNRGCDRPAATPPQGVGPAT